VTLYINSNIRFKKETLNEIYKTTPALFISRILVLEREGYHIILGSGLALF
jgi:hypothetical protein